MNKDDYLILAQAIILCDSTDPNNIVLDGVLWRKAVKVIERIDSEPVLKTEETV